MSGGGKADRGALEEAVLVGAEGVSAMEQKAGGPTKRHEGLGGLVRNRECGRDGLAEVGRLTLDPSTVLRVSGRTASGLWGISCWRQSGG